MMRRIWNCVRLAIADAFLILSAVSLLLYGLVMLIFGAPKEPASCCEIIEAAKSFLWIAFLIGSILFFVEYSSEKKGDHS